MYTVDLSAVKQWTQNSALWVPASISVYCPHCDQLVTFALAEYQHDAGRSTMAATGKCPACLNTISLWTVRPESTRSGSHTKAQCLLVYPPLKGERKPVDRSEVIPERLRRSYEEALKSYNASIWGAAGLLAGRTMEGVMKHLLQERATANLAQNIALVAAEVNLNGPLVELANAVREGRNLSAHFDAERDIDHGTARAMLDLVEYLLEYLFVLPGEVQELREKIEALG